MELTQLYTFSQGFGSQTKAKEGNCHIVQLAEWHSLKWNRGFITIRGLIISFPPSHHPQIRVNGPHAPIINSRICSPVVGKVEIFPFAFRFAAPHETGFRRSNILSALQCVRFISSYKLTEIFAALEEIGSHSWLGAREELFVLPNISKFA